jgi:cyclase
VVRPDTRIIPGHLGPIVGFKEVEQQLTMFAAVRDRVAGAIKAGKTEQEVVASKPTRDFDEGRLGGAITPDRFVSLVYTDLSRKK